MSKVKKLDPKRVCAISSDCKIAVSICLGYVMLYGILAALSKWIFKISLLDELRVIADTMGKELGLTALIALVGSGAVAVDEIKSKVSAAAKLKVAKALKRKMLSR